MGLVVPENAKKYFWNARTGPRPRAGYGTQIGKPAYKPNTVFKKLGIPLHMSWFLINNFPTLALYKEYLEQIAQEDRDVLVCYDWHTLFEPNSADHWGHVCVLDNINFKTSTLRIIDPESNAPKWREVKIADMYKAMLFHGEKNSGGFWELYSGKRSKKPNGISK